MSFDGVDELEIDDEDVQPMRLALSKQDNAGVRKIPAAFARPPAVSPPRLPGPKPAPVSLVPAGWPNLLQQQTAPTFQQLVHSNSAQAPTLHAQVPVHQPQPNRSVLVPSRILPHSNVQQSSMQPLASKRPAEQLSAPLSKRMMPMSPMGQGPSAAQPCVAAPVSKHMQCPQPSFPAMHAHPPAAAQHAAQLQEQLRGTTIPGPAGALQRRMQQGLAQDEPAAGLSGPPRLRQPSQEADPAFLTPQWLAAVHACSRLEGEGRNLRQA